MRARSSAGRTLVIGVGNPLRGDDGAGAAVIGRLAPRLPPGVAVLAADGEPAALIEALAAVERAVLVDCVASGAPPGTLHRLEAGDGPLPAAGVRGSSSHSLGVAEAVELARALGRLPPRLTVWGIEGTSFAHGAPLSAAVRSAVDEAAEAILAELAPGTVH